MNPAGDAAWPLNIPPRSLAVLTQVILLEQQIGRNDPTADTSSDALITQIWTKFLQGLFNLAIRSETELNGGMTVFEQFYICTYIIWSHATSYLSMYMC